MHIIEILPYPDNYSKNLVLLRFFFNRSKVFILSFSQLFLRPETFAQIIVFSHHFWILLRILLGVSVLCTKPGEEEQNYFLRLEKSCKHKKYQNCETTYVNCLISCFFAMQFPRF